MRKQTKLVAVLSAAALLAIGASMTSFAADAGWKDQDGTWVYLDNDGERVTDTWKKSGNHYFYLDENGEMATNAIIDDGENKYYVNEAGAKVTNQWVAVDNEDDETVGENDDITTLWYYFGSTGKAYKDDDKTINGYKYIFDEEGHMLSGWQTVTNDGGTEDLYYLGDENEGWAATGWQLLEPQDSESEAYDDEEWFYFKSSGKAVMNDREYINGFYYTFNPDGVMQNKWVYGTPGAPTSGDHAHYDAEIGYQGTGWVLAYDDKTNEDEDDQSWYYLDSKGVPFNEYGTDDVATESTATKKDNEKWKVAIKKVAAKKIKGKTYLFDQDGKMQTGVFKLTDVDVEGSTSDLNGVYYFNTDAGSVNGQMVTGKQTVTYDGDNYYYYFQKDGEAYTNYIADGVYYDANGERVNAEDGNTYSVVPVTAPLSVKGSTLTVPADSKVIVGSTGKVRKSGKVKIDGVQYTVDDYKVIDQENID